MTYRQKIGTEYEYYVLENIRKNYEQVWHWKNFPEKLMYELNLIKDYDKYKKYRLDIGADLVAFKNNKYYFIQCKNFKETIYIDNLAGFYFLLYENNLDGILYYNGTLSERLVDLSTGKIPFINLPFNNENIIFNELKLNIIPRDYQIEAYKKLKNLDKSILSLPCSMGKTYISSMLAKDYNNIIILSPTRALAQQNLEKFKEYFTNTYNYILVSVDGSTKTNNINKILKEKNVISSTYDSCVIINFLIKKLENCYIIVDEFHNLSKNNLTDENNDIYKLLNYETNKVFISATPIKNFMNILDTNIYTYKWKDAIENKYICDFNIYLPILSCEIINFLDIIKDNYTQLELKIIKKAYNLVKGMLFNGDKKCICYLTTIEKANIFNKILILISNTFNVEIEREQIDCNTKKLKRNEIINKFKNSDKLFILLNVHVLDEGIDIPECDSVYITQPNNNIINIVQRMCRANRIYKNKTNCNIYLWCTEKKTKYILNYLFEKMDESIKNKINKICVKKIEKIIFEPSKTEINCKNDKVITYFNNAKDGIIEYIKKNSTIPDEFINKFFVLYDYKINENNLIIDFNDLCDWLIMRKDNMKKTLIRSYIKDVDYKIKIINSLNRGRPKEEIFITPECMKKICMLSSTKKAEESRTYFINIEKLIDKYKQTIITELNEKIKTMENNK
jgi:superfamily II DNA or RNA helicase/phage anti-repressor protein